MARTRGAKKTGYLHKLKPGDIISVSIGGRIAQSLPGRAAEEVFRAGTQAAQGSYTHSALYVGNGEVVEARIGKGVEKRPLREAMKGLSFSVHRPDVPASERKKAVRFAEKQVGKGYDSTALLVTGAGTALPEWVTRLVDKKIVAPPQDAQAFTCSNLVTAAYHKVDLTSTGMKRLATPGDLRASDKLKLVAAVHKKDFKEALPSRLSRIRRRWKDRGEVTPDDKFVKRGSVLHPSLLDAFSDEMHKSAAIPASGSGFLNRVTGAVKQYAGHMSGSTLRSAQQNLANAKLQQPVLEGLRDAAMRRAGGVRGIARTYPAGAPPAVEGFRRASQAVSKGVENIASSAASVRAAQQGRNRAMAGTAAAVGIPLAGAAAWKAKKTLSRPQPPMQQEQQPKMASLDEMAEELIKIAAMSASEQRRKRHEYYVANRQKLLQQGRAYRQANRAQIQRKQRFYRRQVQSGARRQRQRVSTGGMSFTYMGYK